MGRKKKHEEHENLERWLVSYADFITLLFATFVVLYALSQLDIAKFKKLKQSISEAFTPTILKGKPDIMPDEGAKILSKGSSESDINILPAINPQLEMKKMEEVKQEMEKSAQQGDLKGVSIKTDKRGLVISLLDSVFFDPGSAMVKPAAFKTLDKVSFMIKKNFNANKIQIEGHTDNDPLSTALYPSNWELSAGRASSVVRYMIGKFKMPKQNFAAVGFADTMPVASNSTYQGKQKNRRVEVVILNSETSSTLPTPANIQDDTTQQKAQTPGKSTESNITILDSNDAINALENQNITPTNENQPPVVTTPVINLKDSIKPKPQEIIEVKTEAVK